MSRWWWQAVLLAVAVLDTLRLHDYWSGFLMGTVLTGISLAMIDSYLTRGPRR